MLADRIRVEAYTRALRRSVRPGSIVVEIGTGPGVFAILACQLGAARVHAIEPAEIIQVAREVAAANGYADKIEFHEDLSTRVNLPAKADVIVSDLRGVLPFCRQHIASISDAKRRLLATGGVLIPRKDTVWATLVEAPKTYGEIVDCWEKNGLGVDLTPARRLAVNGMRKVSLQPEQMLAAPQIWAMLDYSAIEEPNWRGSLQWTVERAGTCHGVVLWFDTELAEGVGFSNAPGKPEAIYGSQFLPWERPVDLEPGRTVCVDLAARLTGGEYVWRWSSRVFSSETPAKTIARFDQSQLGAAVLSPAKLKRSAADYVPQLSDEGLLRIRALELMDGKLSLEEIAKRLIEDFPGRFGRWQDALSYAAARSAESSR